MGRSGKWSWFATWLPIFCNNLLSRVPGIRRRKPSNILLYSKSCEVWGKNSLNMKRFNRLVEALDLWLRSIVVYQKVLTTGRAFFIDIERLICTVGQGYSFFAVLFFVASGFIHHQNFHLLNTGKLMLGVFCKLILAIKPDKRCCLKKVSHGDKK